MVAGGHRQGKTIFRDDNAYPTLNEVTLKVFLTKCASRSWSVQSLDFDATYLNAKLDETVFLELPQGFKDTQEIERDEDQRLKSNDSIYGLKEAGKQWFQLLKKI